MPTWTSTANGIEQDRSHSIVGQVNSVFGPTFLNEAKAQYAREPRPRPYTGPDLPDTAIGNFPGGVDHSFRFGRPFFLPLDSATDQRFQAADTMTLVRGAHVLKAGGEVNWTSMDQTFVGFARGRYIFTGGMDQFEAFVNDPTSDAATSAFVLYLQRVPLGGRSIAESGQQVDPGVGAGLLRPGQVERQAEPDGERRPALGRPQGAADADAAVTRRRSRKYPERPALPDRHRRDSERLPGLAAAPRHHVGSGQ